MSRPALMSIAKRSPVVLAVDDDRTLRMALIAMLEALEYTVVEAQDGAQALNMLLAHKEEIDAVLLDRRMPVMDGMELVKRMKEFKELRNLPVVMQTAADHPEEIREGIDAGIFYYLTKPVNQDVLKSVLSAAVRQTEQQRQLLRELKRHRTSFDLIENCKFRLRTLSEAEHLATFLANCFPDAERAVNGLAELLINAVEHGNLGITYKEKGALVASRTWREEVERRARLQQNQDKTVAVTYRHVPEGHYVTIADQGSGFDWKNYLYVEPARATDGYGRGIAQANAFSFDKLSYNDAGNEVTGFVGNKDTLAW